MSTTQYPLDEIAAAQRTGPIFAFDRGCLERKLARLQRIHASKCTQLEAFYHFFEESQPDIVLRNGGGQELALRLPNSRPMGELYANLRDVLDQELAELERQIVELHREVQQDAQEIQLHGHTPKGQPDYAPAILALCRPQSPTPRVLPLPAPADSHAPAAQVA